VCIIWEKFVLVQTFHETTQEALRAGEETFVGREHAGPFETRKKVPVAQVNASSVNVEGGKCFWLSTEGG